MTLVKQNETENVVCMMWTFYGQIVLSLSQMDPTLSVMTSTSFGCSRVNGRRCVV